MKIIWIIFFLLLSCLLNINAQKRMFYYDLGSSGGFISSGHVPFWLRSNQYGSIPLDNASLSLIGSIRKDYSTIKTRILDWGASVEGRVNLGNKSNFTLVEGYVKLRISIFEIRTGRAKEIMGLCDTILSSGSYSISGNALGIPKVQIAIPEFYSLPMFGELFAFKGNYAHGWLGETSMQLNDSIKQIVTYFHQSSLYGRFGKPDWKWKLYGGFNHQVFWGNEKKFYGDIFTLSQFRSYLYVITGTAYGNRNILSSKIGNHLGSIDIGFEYELEKIKFLLYRQNIYDAGALFHLANIRDGLTGLSLVNKKISGNVFKLRKMLIEVLFTKNQAGELWSPLTPSGDEDYYNNYQYTEGWSYKGFGLGTPFIGTRAYLREGLPSDPQDYYVDNRVVAFHFGFEGSIQKWNFILKSSYSLNYGTFGTSVEGHVTGNIRTVPLFGIFNETKQFSAYLDANKKLKKGLNFSIIGAFDVGELYYNSFGLLFRLSKLF